MVDQHFNNIAQSVLKPNSKFHIDWQQLQQQTVYVPHEKKHSPPVQEPLIMRTSNVMVVDESGGCFVSIQHPAEHSSSFLQF